jgi:hypothetical protein
LFSQTNVYAIETTDNVVKEKTVEEKKIDKILDINEIFDFVLKFIYALLWPVLFIA